MNTLGTYATEHTLEKNRPLALSRCRSDAHGVEWLGYIFGLDGGAPDAAAQIPRAPEAGDHGGQVGGTVAKQRTCHPQAFKHPPQMILPPSSYPPSPS